MIATYEAPALTMYGSVSALTNSAKCTPGSDQVWSASDAHIFVTPSNQTYDDGAQMQFLTGDIVHSGTECINLFDGSRFIAG